jgi:hypothetical protein
MRATGFLLAWLSFALVTAAAAGADQAPEPAYSAQPAAPSTDSSASTNSGQPLIMHMHAAFAGASARMRSQQVELRHDLLAVLTPAQRSWIAATLGQLAVAADPDAAGAARRIDAALSPGQRQTVRKLAQVAAVRAQVAMALNAGSFPPAGAFSAALASQSAGTLIVEILTAGTLETLRER